jgi:hypothetical protein
MPSNGKQRGKLLEGTPNSGIRSTIHEAKTNDRAASSPALKNAGDPSTPGLHLLALKDMSYWLAASGMSNSTTGILPLLASGGSKDG